jgi:hypothetical protein
MRKLLVFVLGFVAMAMILLRPASSLRMTQEYFDATVQYNDEREDCSDLAQPERTICQQDAYIRFSQATYGMQQWE